MKYTKGMLPGRSCCNSATGWLHSTTKRSTWWRDVPRWLLSPFVFREKS